jgi:hypothetical protein
LLALVGTDKSIKNPSRGVDHGHFEQVRHRFPPSAGLAEKVDDEPSIPQNGGF